MFERRPGGLQLPQMIEQRLRAADGEGRDHDGAAALDRALDDGAEQLGGIARLVDAVAVGGFDDDVVGLRDRLRIEHHRIAVAAEITGKDDAPAAPFDVGGGSAQDVAGMPERQRRPSGKLDRLAERNGREEFERALGIANAVERQGGLVLGEALPVRVFGILLLEMAAVLQDQLCHIARRGRREDAAAEAVAHELRQIAGMVEMRVGQDDGVDAAKARPATAPSSARAGSSGPGTGRSRSGCACPSCVSRCFEPVTVPAPPREVSVSMACLQMRGCGEIGRIAASVDGVAFVGREQVVARPSGKRRRRIDQMRPRTAIGEQHAGDVEGAAAADVAARDRPRRARRPAAATGRASARAAYG